MCELTARNYRHKFTAAGLTSLQSVSLSCWLLCWGGKKKSGISAYPRGCLSSSLRTVCSQNSNTKWRRLFLLNTSSRLTRFTCFSCCRHHQSIWTVRDKSLGWPNSKLSRNNIKIACVFLATCSLFSSLQEQNVLLCTWRISTWSNKWHDKGFVVRFDLWPLEVAVVCGWWCLKKKGFSWCVEYEPLTWQCCTVCDFRN